MKMESRSKRSYSVVEIAELTGVSVPFVWQEIRRGKLRAVRLGRRRLVLAEEWEKWLTGGKE